MSYIYNGIDQMHWGVAGNAATNDRITDWCEGWQIIPYGLIPMHLSAQDWFNLNTNYRKWRVKDFGVELEGIIPFQEILQGGGTREAVTSFSNKPNIHYYVDNMELLPELEEEANLDRIAHNNMGKTPYGNYSETRLRPVNFKFQNLDPTTWCKYGYVEPTADHPQEVWSLYNSGNVKTLQPGQTLKQKYRMRDDAWRGVRPHINSRSKMMCDNGTDQDKMQELTAPSYWAGFCAEGAVGMSMTNRRSVSVEWTGVGLTPAISTENGGTGQQKKMNNWCDTMNALPSQGPPYLLVKSEAYYGTSDEPLPIYHQVHLHYTCTIEAVEIDGYGSMYIPLDMQHLPAMNQITRYNSDNQFKQSMTRCGNSNITHRAYGPSESSIYYT